MFATTKWYSIIASFISLCIHTFTLTISMICYFDHLSGIIEMSIHLVIILFMFIKREMPLHFSNNIRFFNFSVKLSLINLWLVTPFYKHFKYNF